MYIVPTYFLLKNISEMIKILKWVYRKEQLNIYEQFLNQKT